MRPTTDKILNVALLHLAPRAGDLAFNKLLIEAAIMKAARGGADWVITPELAVILSAWFAAITLFIHAFPRLILDCKGRNEQPVMIQV